MNNKKITALTLATLMSSLALVGCNSNGAQKDLAAEILQKLIIDGDTYKQVVGDFTVASEITHKGKTYGITWSENSDFMEVKVEDKKVTIDVTRPAVGEKNESYELTATIDVDGYEASKTFKGLVIAEEPVPEYTDASDLFADVLSHKITPLQKPVKYTGIVSRTYESGFYVTDADGHSVYVYSSPADLKVGDKVELVGKFDAYYSMYQFKKPTVTVVAKDQTVPALNVYNEEALTATELNALEIKKGDLIHGSVVKAKGIVYDDGYGVALLDPTDFTKSIVLYNSNLSKEVKEKILEQEGKLVEFNTIYYTNHEKDGKVEPYLTYDDNAETVPAGVALDAETQFNYSTFMFEVPEVVTESLPSEIKISDTVKYKVTYEADKVNEKLWIESNGKVKEIPEKGVKIPNVKVTIAHPTDETKNVVKKYKDVLVGIDKYSTFADLFKENAPKKGFVKAQTIAQIKDGTIAYENGKFYLISNYKTVTLDVNKDITLQAGGDHFHNTQQIKNHLVISTKDTTNAPVIDYSKAKTIDQNKLGDALAAAAATDKKGIELDKLATNEGTKEMEALVGQLVKIDAKVIEMTIKGKKVLGLEAKGFCDSEFNRVKLPEDLLASGFAVGDEVTAYGFSNGAFGYKGAPTTAYQFISLKVEKKAA